MRLLFVDPAMVALARKALAECGDDWDALLEPAFEAPPRPEGISAERWPRLAENVARAERVSASIRGCGLEETAQRFRESPHAVEAATIIAAAVQVDKLELGQLRQLLTCEIDVDIAYGTFLALLLEVDAERSEVIEIYEDFHRRVSLLDTTEARWLERAQSVQDGLASLYVRAGRLDDAHQLFSERHRGAGDLTAGLAACRSFLAAGHVGRAMQWLELAAVKADQLDRPMMAFRLRKKREALRRRMT